MMDTGLKLNTSVIKTLITAGVQLCALLEMERTFQCVSINLKVSRKNFCSSCACLNFCHFSTLHHSVWRQQTSSGKLTFTLKCVDRKYSGWEGIVMSWKGMLKTKTVFLRFSLFRGKVGVERKVFLQWTRCHTAQLTISGSFRVKLKVFAAHPGAISFTLWLDS